MSRLEQDVPRSAAARALVEAYQCDHCGGWHVVGVE